MNGCTGAISRVFPDSNITKLQPWNEFNDTYSSTLFLNPVDPMYEQIGNLFVSEVRFDFR